ncbi:MAG: hypothetical protein KAV41_03085 [Candidatus Pacebacteria bacterium]|nr:hypothetical protein [Candidatus Paceibacterota bacterium]
MTAQEIRRKYLEFFEAKGHSIIPGASLIPENDPTVLFTTAGMHPLIPYLMGEKHPEGKRLVNFQKCVRTSDIEEVGDATHHTFFEMLGNWSLGDPKSPDGTGQGYWKKEALRWAWEFLTSSDWLGLDPNKIAVSIFEGNADASFDEESYNIWQKIGVPEKHIAKLGKKENWWGPAGETGPCGPCSEIFYWIGKPDKIPETFDAGNELWVEVWNNVFMEYNKQQNVMLIDGMHCLYDKNFNLDKKLLDLINSYNFKKILVINANGEKAKNLVRIHNMDVFTFEKEITKDSKVFFDKLLEKQNLSVKNVFYFDHKQDNLEGAMQAGIKNTFLYSFGDDLDNLKKFINDNSFSYKKLSQKNVDTGMGLERITAVLQRFAGNYKTELWANIISKIEELSGKKYFDPAYKKAMRIIADHLKAATFIIGDDKGVAPSNTDQGYIVRRLIRRAIRYGKQLGIESELWTKEIAKIVISDYETVYPELKRNANFISDVEREQSKRRNEVKFLELPSRGANIRRSASILEELDKEETQFSKTLEKGLKEIEKLAGLRVEEVKAGEPFPLAQTVKNSRRAGKLLFNLYTEKGFPAEMSIEEINKKLNEVNFEIISGERKKEVLNAFREEMRKHQELSRTAAAGKFKGGLADASEETTKLHTAAHLLLAALRKVLGDAVEQKGSNITAERLRFDFSYSEKMTDEQKRAVEKLVNEAIQKNMPVVCEEMSLEEAKERGALGAFESKYGKRVKVYKIAAGNEIFSYEICGGPHIKNTGNLGKFKIKKEQSSSLGVRRIKAVLE